jgi:hypothetical protein
MLGIYFDVVVVQTRLDERLPLILEMYIRVLVPLWIPPIRSIDVLDPADSSLDVIATTAFIPTIREQHHDDRQDGRSTLWCSG